MGNAGSHGLGGGAAGGRTPQPRQPLHWQHSLPSDPLLKASHLKVLPDLDINPRLRSTNNGAILHSGGTISGRRPLSLALPHDRDPAHNGVYRSKSITAQDPYDADRQPRFSYLSNQRDPLHRSQTHLHLEEIEDSFAMQSKRFGSEPDLRNSQEPQPKAKVINKNVKKKYKAPPPPHLLNNQGGSSPDSWRDQPPYQQHQAPQVPSRKLRLFKTRAETKKNPKHNHDIKSNGFIHHKEFPPFENNDRHFSNDAFEQSRFIEREKMLRSPSKERDEYIKYPSSREDDMVQTQSSLRREENILQTAFSRQEFLRTKHSQQNMYREKSKREESKFDSNKAFRNSERFKKQNTDPQVLRREKSFDNSLMHELNHAHDANRLKNDRSNHFGASRDETDKLESRFEHREVEKSVESNKKTNGIQNSLASAEFQAELLMATRKLRAVNKTPEPSGTKTETSSSNKVETTNRKPSNDKKVLDKEGRSSRTPDAKPAAAKNSSNQSKSNLVTLDRSKLVKSKERAPRIVKEEKKEDAVKSNGVKVLPSNDKVGRENNRNRRESRVLADRGQASGKESTPEVSPSRVKQDTSWDRNQQNQPSKSFYFGMGDNTIQPVEEELNVHEKVRRHLEMNYKDFPKMTNYPVEDMVKKAPINGYNTRLELPQGSSESALSSEPEIDDPMSAENNPHGIALQLRPTLPKKQLEIPRFSPAAAWRLLAALEAETEAEAATNLVTSVEKVALVDKEDRIERHQRPRPARSTHDKSGDSGISGDAGPANEDCPDTPTLPPSPVRREEPSSQWTPQQDLEEESSSDAGGPGSPHGAAVDSAPAKFSARQQVFSLSLPRETHIAHLADKSKQSQQAFNSLQKFRKSVSGALGNALGASKRPEDLEENSADEQADNNWFLSRSAPNSLNNGLGSPNAKMSVAKSHDSGQHQTPPSSDQEDERLPPVSLGMMRQQPPFSYLATGGHVMYLPQYDSQRSSGQAVDRLAGPRDQPYSMGYQEGMRQKTGSDGEMEELDPASKDKYKAVRDGRQMMMSRSKSSGELILNSRNVAASKPRVKGKRFTFQSTVRQIERKRLADKLSREAETKERQRLSELEAMRRVEEEFQRKRAREKASIRQQLRLVSLDESCSSLPSSWGGQGRIEPEGAVSPSPPPASGASGGSSSDGLARAPATRVLSEYRQATREYRDYRRGPQPPTVHPPACYNMPRAPASRTAVVVGVGVGGAAWAAEAANDSDNYRREFARGRRAPSSSGSDLSQGARLVTPPRW